MSFGTRTLIRPAAQCQPKGLVKARQTPIPPRSFGPNRHHWRLRGAGGLRAGISGWCRKERRLSGGCLPQFPCQRAAPDRHQGECWGQEPRKPDSASPRRQTPRGQILSKYSRTALRHGSCLPRRRHHGRKMGWYTEVQPGINPRPSLHPLRHCPPCSHSLFTQTLAEAGLEPARRSLSPGF